MNTPASGGAGAASRWRPLRFIRARPRLSTSTAVFVLAVMLLSSIGVRLPLAVLLGFDLGALLYLVALAIMFCRCSTEHLGRQARLQDTGRHATLAVVVAVSLVVLGALATELHAARSGALAVAVATASVVLSWLFVNTSFALHYAHSYYGDDDCLQGGLDFPSALGPDYRPDYWDFVYFSFVIGMCFQTSDVAVSSRRMRHITLLHSVVAFFFNVFILAISVSVVAGLGG
ncbi:DUF1345 domain-containing protein [Rhodanobacter aciditrophus]|uniref:DUF1345 domain-containing protein n=1 Tax=Rhodanobacter aciditrophus TaxID=1623218 RepID=UPI003CF46A75